MTIGLYTIPTSNLIFRKLDGEWTAHSAIVTNDHKEAWNYYSTEKGKPVDSKMIEANKGRQCLTHCRFVAKVLYGVPNDVELYAEDPKSIQKYDKVAYNMEYNKKNYDRIELKVPKDVKERWKQRADEAGLSLTEYIRRRVEGEEA